MRCPPYITGPDPGISARLMHVECMTHMHLTTYVLRQGLYGCRQHEDGEAVGADVDVAPLDYNDSECVSDSAAICILCCVDVLFREVGRTS